jgi:hypothetical protein
MPFEAILDEVDQLRNVSTRLEGLAEDHPPVWEELIKIAGNVRSTTVAESGRPEVVQFRTDFHHAEMRASSLVDPWLWAGVRYRYPTNPVRKNDFFTPAHFR